MQNKDWNELLPELFAKMLSDDADAVAEVYNHYKDGIIRYAYQIVKNWADAQDTYQLAMIYVVSHLKQIKDPRTLSEYIRRAVHSRAVNLVNSKERRHNVQDTGEPGMGYFDTATDGKTPETVLDEYQRRELLNMVLNEMDEKYRTVLIMAYIRDLSAKEIAEKLELPVSTITGRLAYARKKLTEILRKYAEWLENC